MPDSHDLEITLKSKVPIVVVETQEESRVKDLLVRLAMNSFRSVFYWSVVQGLRPLHICSDSIEDTSEAKDVLKHIATCEDGGMYILFDFHPYLNEDPYVVRQLKEIALSFEKTGVHVILVSFETEVPPELKPYTMKFQLKLPNDDQIRRIIIEELRDWSAKNRDKQIRSDHKVIASLVRNLRGLSHDETRRLARGLIVDDGALTIDDLDKVNKAKAEILDLEGAIHYESDTSKFSEVAGLSKLKDWLKMRHQAIIGETQTDDKPKGVMLLGMQGSGKSLAAKAVAGVLKLPLLRLDVAALYNKYIGETESSLRKALTLADTMSPAVLWIDEIEKGLSGSSNDDGVSKRVLGTLLTWMSERTSSVFIVATSNDVTTLPPELIRKGRFDELFFVDLPNDEIRQEIFRIHMKKRKISAEKFDLEELSRLSSGFSGAEIESAVVAAVYTARSKGEPLSDDHLRGEIERTSPLSVVMAESLNGLRAWARDRTVFVD